MYSRLGYRHESRLDAEYFADVFGAEHLFRRSRYNDTSVIEQHHFISESCREIKIVDYTDRHRVRM